MYDYCDQDCNDDDVNDIRIIMTSVMTYENENNKNNHKQQPTNYATTALEQEKRILG